MMFDYAHYVPVLRCPCAARSQDLHVAGREFRRQQMAGHRLRSTRIVADRVRGIDLYQLLVDPA